MSSGSVDQEVLNGLNVEQQKNENLERLKALGGVTRLAESLGISIISGLTDKQVLEMRNKFGCNVFPESPMEGFFSLLIGSLNDFTLMVLIAAACVSIGIGAWQEPDHGWIEGVAILIAVFVVAMVTATNDYTKELQFRALEKSSQTDERTSVIRNNAIQRINPADLVVGDIIKLQAGDSIPADSIVVDSNVVMANESALTGESLDLKKSRDGDCFLLSSCVITEGEEVKALVTGIGLNSQWGRIKKNLVSEAVNTPLQDKLEEMSKQIGFIGLGAAVVTFSAAIINIWAREGGKDVLNGVINAFILAVVIVVVAIPEGLPLAVTIALAYSTKKMYEDQCFIRILSACETMGNVTNICSDKTGTLTENQMTVVEGMMAGVVYDQTSFKTVEKDMSPIARQLLVENVSANRVAYLMIRGENGNLLPRPQVIGNKTEGGLLCLLNSWNIDIEEEKKKTFQEGRDKIFAFNSTKKRSTTILFSPSGAVRLYCKGASEVVLRDCTTYLVKDGTAAPLTEKVRTTMQECIKKMASGALRTLVLAHRDFASANELPRDWKDSPPDSEQLCCDFIVGIIDPLRGDVVEAVRLAQRAGVTVRMCTGDNIDTACAIARNCGILTANGVTLEGPQFRAMTPLQADGMLNRLQVLARSSPDDKFLLVTRLNGNALPENEEEWKVMHAGKPGNVKWETHRDVLMPGYRSEWAVSRKHGGEVVGVTGDGTNDAPALKAADVGLSMGITGTKVAQGASDIVLLDDKFSTIVRAIMWGRSIYDSIRKFLQFQLVVNIVALTLEFVGVAAGAGQPLNAVMLLWLNLVMDTMGALALATEPPTMELLDRKPYKRTASLTSRPMWRNIFCQALFQLTLIFIIMFDGEEIFGVNHLKFCIKFDVNSKPDLWDVSQNFRKVNTTSAFTVSCGTFRSTCGGDGECYERLQTIQNPKGNPYNFKYSSISGFEDRCLECKKLDYTLSTIVFNTFVFCQIFNEICSREIFDNVGNMFKGIHKNPIFIGIILISMGCQIFLIYVGGDFVKTTPLSAQHFLESVGLAAITFLIGVLERFIPIKEDPNDFFYNDFDINAVASSTPEIVDKQSHDTIGSGRNFVEKPTTTKIIAGGVSDSTASSSAFNGVGVGVVSNGTATAPKMEASMEVQSIDDEDRSGSSGPRKV